jgi:hypothetical protein
MNSCFKTSQNSHLFINRTLKNVVLRNKRHLTSHLFKIEEKIILLKLSPN